MQFAKRVLNYTLIKAKELSTFIFNCMLLGGGVTLIVFAVLSGVIVTDRFLMYTYDSLLIFT